MARVGQSYGVWDQNWDQGFAKNQRGRREWYLTATPADRLQGARGTEFGGRRVNKARIYVAFGMGLSSTCRKIGTASRLSYR